MSETKKPYGTLQINFRAGDMQPQIEARTNPNESPSLTAQRDLERYYVQLRLALPKFSVSEALLLCDVMNGTLTDAHTASLLWANVSDAIEMDRVDDKWKIEGPAFVARLRKLTPFEALAVADACERFWTGPYARDGSHEEILRSVGLVK